MYCNHFSPFRLAKLQPGNGSFPLLYSTCTLFLAVKLGSTLLFRWLSRIIPLDFLANVNIQIGFVPKFMCMCQLVLEQARIHVYTCTHLIHMSAIQEFLVQGSLILTSYLLCSGYAALFRHPDDELNYCVYLIPGNPQVTNDKLPYWHEHLMQHDLNISRALGKKAKIERMKVGKCTWVPSKLVKFY